MEPSSGLQVSVPHCIPMILPQRLGFKSMQCWHLLQGCQCLCPTGSQSGAPKMEDRKSQ